MRKLRYKRESAKSESEGKKNREWQQHKAHCEMQ